MDGGENKGNLLHLFPCMTTEHKIALGMEVNGEIPDLHKPNVAQQVLSQVAQIRYEQKRALENVVQKDDFLDFKWREPHKVLEQSLSDVDSDQLDSDLDDDGPISAIDAIARKNSMSTLAEGEASTTAAAAPPALSRYKQRLQEEADALKKPKKDKLEIREVTRERIVEEWKLRAKIVAKKKRDELKKNDEVFKTVSKDRRRFSYTGYDIDNDIGLEPTPLPETSDEEKGRELCKQYEKSCEVSLISPLKCITSVLLSGNLTVLDLSEVKMTSLQMKFFSRILKELEDLTKLTMRNSGLDEVGTVMLSHSLSRLKHIDYLDLSYNALGRDGFAAFSEMIADNQEIRYLDLSKCQLRETDADDIGYLVEENMSLRELRLSDNMFWELCAEKLSEALASNDTLERLDLSWNQFRCKSAELIAKGIEENRGLLSVDLSWNGFGREGATAIALALEANKTLLELNLSNNRLDEEAMKELMQGLKENFTLTTLQLARNPIHADVAKWIVKELAEHEGCVIDELDLDGIVVDDDFVEQLNNLEMTGCEIRVIFGEVHSKNADPSKKDNGPSTKEMLKRLYGFLGKRGLQVKDLYKPGEKKVKKKNFKQKLESFGEELDMNPDMIQHFITKISKGGKIDLVDLGQQQLLFKRAMFQKMERKAARKRKQLEDEEKLRAYLAEQEEENRKNGVVSTDEQKKLLPRASIAVPVENIDENDDESDNDF